MTLGLRSPLTQIIVEFESLKCRNHQTTPDKFTTIYQSLYPNLDPGTASVIESDNQSEIDLDSDYMYDLDEDFDDEKDYEMQLFAEELLPQGQNPFLDSYFQSHDWVNEALLLEAQDREVLLNSFMYYQNPNEFIKVASETKTIDICSMSQKLPEVLGKLIQLIQLRDNINVDLRKFNIC